jgi:hypothetical protein
MNKYHVSLAKNWNKSEPFVTEWDYELLGDKFRAEFDVYFAEQEKQSNSGMGKTKQLLKGEYVKKFMITKRINLVDNPVTGNLKSVFILRKDEKKLIDERAKGTLAPRFQYRFKTKSDGSTTEPEGFLDFELVEGVEKKEEGSASTFQVSGNNIEYFEEDKKELIEELPVVEEDVVMLVCEECGKEFKDKRSLHGHKLSHMKAKK